MHQDQDQKQTLSREILILRVYAIDISPSFDIYLAYDETGFCSPRNAKS